MTRLALTLACGTYDRTAPLKDGTVQPEDIDLTYLAMPPGELFRRQARDAEFEVAEFSLSTLMVMIDSGDDRLIAIPVFPSRYFRHSFIFVNAAAGIDKPQDLVGKRVGSQGYQATAGLWQRAVLQHDYGVGPGDFEWFFGGLNEPSGHGDRYALQLPDTMRTHQIPATETLNDMLERGEIDALLTANIPECFRSGSPNVRRLFVNYREVEQEYFARTGFFPIMHTVTIRRDVYEKNPWVARSMFNAFEQAKALVSGHLRDGGDGLYAMLPWVADELERTTELMGADYWPYGYEQNREILHAIAVYAQEQALTKKTIDMERLFAPETLQPV